MRIAQSHAFRVMLVWSILLYPMASVKAQTPAAPAAASKPVLSKAYLTSESVAAVCLRPQQVLANPAYQMLPIEVAKAAGEKYIGMDPAKIIRAVAVAEPPLGTTPFYAVFLQSSEAFDLTRLAPELTAHTQPGKIGGRDCLVSAHPALPCIMMLGQKTLVAASKGMLDKLLDRNRPKASGILSDLIANQPPGDDLYLAVNIEALAPLIQMGMMAGAKDIPPEMRKFTQIPMLVQSVEAKINLDIKRPSSAMAHAGTAENADKLQALIQEGMQVAQAKMREDMEQNLSRLRSSDDPVERAMAAYMERMSKDYANTFTPKRRGDSLVLFETDGDQAKQLTSVAVIGVLIALLLPAVQNARAAARRTASMNNMKQLMLSHLNYESSHKSFSPHAIYSKDGKPLLSWRVAVLPYLEQKALYDQFHLDEPWDSPHNKSLIPMMPSVFIDPSSPLPQELGKTHYLAPVGPGLLFEKSPKGMKLRQVTDGLSNTIALVQVNDAAAVTWTQPTDWQYNPAAPMQGLGGLHQGIFNAAFADGHIEAVSTMLDPTVLKAMLTRAGNEVIPNF